MTPETAPAGARKPICFVALPYHAYILPETLFAVLGCATAGRIQTVVPRPRKGSMLPDVFNATWCDALNMRDGIRQPKVPLDLYAMAHSDIELAPYFLDTLYDEKVRFGADVVSAVVPLKEDSGLTSTAYWTPTGPMRLTMKEVAQLPETFGMDDVRAVLKVPAWCGPLLVNTGCWLADLARPWCDEVHFEFLTNIVKEKDGFRVPVKMSEDWRLSKMLHERNCKVLATRKVALNHHGDGKWTNQGAWGRLDHDVDGGV